MDSQLPPLAVATDALKSDRRIVDGGDVQTWGSGFAPPNGMVKLSGFNCVNGAAPTVTVTGNGGGVSAGLEDELADIFAGDGSSSRQLANRDSYRNRRGRSSARRRCNEPITAIGRAGCESPVQRAGTSVRDLNCLRALQSCHWS